MKMREKKNINNKMTNNVNKDNEHKKIVDNITINNNKTDTNINNLNNGKIVFVLMIVSLIIISTILVYATESFLTANVIVLGQESFTLNLHEGWNLVSIPLNVQDNSREAIFPSSIVSAVWQYNNPGGYQVPETIQPKIGYWVKANQDTAITIYGSRPENDEVQVNTGWNLIGVVGNQTISEGFVEAVWEYLPPYSVPSILFEGRGFWVKASQQGTLFTDGLASGTYYSAIDEGVCGNDKREGFEDCDLGDDLACPGSCLSNCKCSYAPKIPSITIQSPERNELYGTRSLLLNVNTIEKVKYLYYKINSGSYSKLCTNCNKYSGTKSFAEGKNNLTVKALAYDGANYFSSVIFYTDTIKPKIIATFPFKKGNGIFGVKYTEANLRKVTLFYGLSSINLSSSKVFSNCVSGTKIWCYDFVNLSDYNGKYIYYRFLLEDPYRNKYSSTKKIFVNIATYSEAMSISGEVISFVQKIFGI